VLGIDGERLSGADAEEGGVEAVGIVEKAPFADGDLALGLGVWIVEIVDIPAAIFGEAGDGVPAVEQELPELFGRVYVARKAAVHRDDGDGLMPLLLDLCQPFLGLVKLEGQTPKVLCESLLSSC
jgi:hypothetical protein